MKILKSEELCIKAYLETKENDLLNHQFELEQDYVRGYAMRLLKGERLEIEINAFSKEQSEIINKIITSNFSNDNGKDLLTFFLLSKAVVNILNKYKI